MALGLVVMFTLMSGPKTINGVTFDIHTMLYAAILVIIGLQTVAFALFSKVFAINARLIPEDDRVKSALKIITLERGLILGMMLSLIGIAGSIYAFIAWGKTSFGHLVPASMMQKVIPSLTFLAVGIQTIFASFFLSVLEIKHK